MDIRQVETYIMIFMLYSVLGWIMESFGSFFYPSVRKFVNRGFLIGPYCPVYGFGVLGITIFLSKYADDFFVLFIMAFIFCGVLEYFTSYIMEKLFNARWWDYSKKKFNLNGRICLETLLPFGIVGSVILKYVNPFYLNLISKMPDKVYSFVAWGFVTIFIIDTIVSFLIIKNLKDISKDVETSEKKDNTEEISKKVLETANDFKDKILDGAGDVASDFKSHVYYISRRVNVGTRRFTRKIKRKTGKITEKIISTPQEISVRLKSNSKIYNKVQNSISSTMKHLTNTQEEMQKRIKEVFAKQSLLHKRITEAFPELKIRFINNKKNNEKK